MKTIAPRICLLCYDVLTSLHTLMTRKGESSNIEDTSPKSIRNEDRRMTQKMGSQEAWLKNTYEEQRATTLGLQGYILFVLAIEWIHVAHKHLMTGRGIPYLTGHIFSLTKLSFVLQEYPLTMLPGYLIVSTNLFVIYEF